MNQWRVKKGNTSIQDVEVKDRDGILVTNLADATSITFEVRASKSATTALISKTKGHGISIDVPTTGFLRITLLPSDTDIDPKGYVMALEIVWNDSMKYEARLYISNQETDRFLVEQDIIQ